MGVKRDRMRFDDSVTCPPITSESPLLAVSENPGSIKVDPEGRYGKTEKNKEIIT